MTSARFCAGIGVIWALFTLGVYLPDIGRGFVKDDFGWVASGARALSQPAAAFTADASGTFYRPLVTLSFAADYAMHGLNARGYGFTNLILYASCALLIFFLLMEFGITPAAAAVGAFAWAVNPSGIEMAVLWLSGRTSLLMTLFSSASVLLFMRGRRTTGVLCFLGALLCKEDAMTVPLIILAATAFRSPNLAIPRVAADAALLAATEALYFVLRSLTHAITPATAPEYYRLTWDASVVAINSAHYLDRAATAMAVLAILAVAAYRVRPILSRDDRRRFGVAAFWFAAALAISVRVPVRSSLYAVFPSIGAALALATWLDAMRRSANVRSSDLRLQVAFASVLLLIPVYRIRNERWVEPARVANRTMSSVVRQLNRSARVGTVVLEDEPDRFSNFANAFGGAATDAVRLYTNRPFDAVVVAQGDRLPVASEIARFRLVHGAVTVVN